MTLRFVENNFKLLFRLPHYLITNRADNKVISLHTPYKWILLTDKVKRTIRAQVFVEMLP